MAEGANPREERSTVNLQPPTLNPQPLARPGSFDVVEVDDTVPNLLGQVPLEVLDFVVASRGSEKSKNTRV
ncbi:MAG: hypothetical protein AAB676_09520 [Verrucomicrobiota bacterium]